MQEQLLFNNGLAKEKSNEPLPLSKQIEQIKKELNPFSTIYVDAEVFKNYLLLQRRALLQSVAADERFMSEVDAILHQIESIMTSHKVAVTVTDSTGFNKTSAISVNGLAIDNLAILEILKKCIAMLKRNTEERRKSYLQIVRDTEKRYNLNNPKKRGRFNRQGV